MAQLFLPRFHYVGLLFSVAACSNIMLSFPIHRSYALLCSCADADVKRTDSLWACPLGLVNCLHPTAPILATGSYDNTAKLWRLSPDGSAATCVATLAGHSNGVYSVAFHPTAPGTSDATSSWWSLSTDPMLDGPADSIQASPKAELTLVSLVR